MRFVPVNAARNLRSAAAFAINRTTKDKIFYHFQKAKNAVPAFKFLEVKVVGKVTSFTGHLIVNEEHRELSEGQSDR